MAEDLDNVIKRNSEAVKNVKDQNALYSSYREMARAYKKKNLLLSGYAYDSKNYAQAAEYYYKAFENAADAGNKLSSLDGAASMYWNLGNKDKWCEVRLKQIELLSDKDKTRLYMDIANETKDRKRKKEMYQLALKYADQMAADIDVKAEVADRMKTYLYELD